jgi:hypothetical protein
MSKNDFLTKQNVSLLWEVIMDDDIMKNKPQTEVSQIIDIFNVNLKKFHDSTNNNNLTELNKNYITVMMNFINKNFSKPVQQVVKKPLVTYEELQNDRLSKFEKDLNSRQQDFTSAMALPVPPTPDFSDKKDEPLSEIEVEVKRYMAQRNYDVEQLNKTITNSNDGQASSWLKPQETSLKAEKMPLPQLNKNPIKYIKIDNETNVSKNVIQKDVIDLNNNNNNKKKVISWADERTDERTDERADERADERTDEISYELLNEQQEAKNIFSKLKTIPGKKDELSDLKEEIKILHQKLDLIINFMNKNN